MDVLKTAVSESQLNLELFGSPGNSPLREDDTVYTTTYDMHSHRMEAMTVHGFNVKACFDDVVCPSDRQSGLMVLGIRYDDPFYEQFEAHYKLGSLKKLPTFKALSKMQVFNVQRGYICIQFVGLAECFKSFDELREADIVILPVTALSVLINFFKGTWPKLIQSTTDKNNAILPVNSPKAYITKTFSVRTQFGLSKQQMVILFQFKHHIKIVLYADPVTQTAFIDVTCNNDQKKIASWKLSIPAMEYLGLNQKLYDDFLLAYKATSPDGSVRQESNLNATQQRGYTTVSYEQTMENLKEWSSINGSKRSGNHSSSSASKRNK